MLTKGAYNWVSKYLKYVVDMVKYGEKWWNFIFSKKWWNGENGDLNFNFFHINTLLVL